MLGLNSLPPVNRGWTPVIIATRDTLQTAQLKNCLKRIPSDAILSKFGVLISPP